MTTRHTRRRRGRRRAGRQRPRSRLCAPRASTPCSSEPAADWTATYGCWVDDLEPASRRPRAEWPICSPSRCPIWRSSTDRRQILVAPVRSARQRGRAAPLPRRPRSPSEPSRARRARPAEATEVELGDGSTIRCRLVIDAAGWPSGLAAVRAHRGSRRGRPAIGVVLPEPPAGDLGTPTLMDFRPVRAGRDDRESTIGPAGVATFAYSMPVRDGWLVEETVLAARPAVEPISLLARLAARLGRHPDTLLGDAVRSEYVRIPMGAPIAAPAAGQPGCGAVRGGRGLHPPGDGLLGRRLAAGGAPGGRCDRRGHRRRRRRLRGGGRSRRGVGRRVADGACGARGCSTTSA